MTAIEYEIKRKLLVHVVIPVKLLWSLVMVYMLQDLAKVPSLAITPKSRSHNQIPLFLLLQTILFFSEQIVSHMSSYKFSRFDSHLIWRSSVV